MKWLFVLIHLILLIFVFFFFCSYPKDKVLRGSILVNRHSTMDSKKGLKPAVETSVWSKYGRLDKGGFRLIIYESV